MPGTHGRPSNVVNVAVGRRITRVVRVKDTALETLSSDSSDGSRERAARTCLILRESTRIWCDR